MNNLDEYVRETYDPNTVQNFNQLKNNTFLIFNHHENQYFEMAKNQLYRDCNHDPTLNGKKLTKEQTCNGVADIGKIFYSASNITILAKYIHKRIKCQITDLKIESGLESIYPIINEHENSNAVRKFFNKIYLKSTMEQVYDIYAENWNHDIDRQMDRLNFIVITTLSDKILTDIKFHSYYLQDISNPLQIEPRNENTRKQPTLPSTMRLKDKLV